MENTPHNVCKFWYIRVRNFASQVFNSIIGRNFQTCSGPGQGQNTAARFPLTPSRLRLLPWSAGLSLSLSLLSRRWMTHKRSPPPTTEPPLKRVRFSKSSPPSSSPDRTHIYASVGDGTMSVELTLPMDIAALAQSYRTAKQKHIVIHELFNEDALQTFCDLYLARPQAEIESGIYKVGGGPSHTH